MQGETQLVLHLEEAVSLLSFFPRDGKSPSGFQIKKAIIKLKLPKRLLYHAHTIAYQLPWTGEKLPTPNPSEQEIREVCRLFRVLESAWDRLPLGGSVRKGRKKFLSYPLVWELLCEQLGYTELAKIFPPLKTKGPIKKQKLIFNLIVEFVNK